MSDSNPPASVFRGKVWRQMVAGDSVGRPLAEWAYRTPRFPQGMSGSDLSHANFEVQRETMMGWFQANHELANGRYFGFSRATSVQAVGPLNTYAPNSLAPNQSIEIVGFGQGPFLNGGRAPDLLRAEFAEFVPETVISSVAELFDGLWQRVPPETLLPLGACLDLLLQTVIVFGDKTTEGRLVQSVAVPWFDIIDVLRNDPAAAFQIPAYKWEEIIAGSYTRAGFDEVILTPRSGDAGRDVIATIRGIGTVRVIDQVKAYKPGLLVTADDARALYGVLMLDGAAKGFLTTTSDFAPLLTKDTLLGPIIPSRIELINGKNLLSRLEELARKKTT
jgi:restriction system protein